MWITYDDSDDRYGMVLGCLGPGWHTDDPDDPQQRHHQKPTNLPLETLNEEMAPSCATRPGVGPRLVYVPDQHGPHGAQAGLPRGSG